MRSGLSGKSIDVILTTAAPQPKDSTKKRTTISRSRFYAAVRLVQLRQQSIKVTNLDLNKMITPKGKPLEPPYFDGLGQERRSSRPHATANREQNPGARSNMKVSKSSTELELDKQQRRLSTDAVIPTGLARSTSDSGRGQRSAMSRNLTSTGEKPRELRSCLRNSFNNSKKHSSSKSLGGSTTTSRSTSVASLVNDGEAVYPANSTHNDKCCPCCKTSSDKVAALEAELVSARKLIKSLYDEMDTMRMNTERALAKSTLQKHQSQQHRHGGHRREHNHHHRQSTSNRDPRASIPDRHHARENMRGSANVRSGSRKASTSEANTSRSKPAGTGRDRNGNFSEYSHSRPSNHDVQLTVPMSYRNEDYHSSQDSTFYKEDFDDSESLDMATDLQQIHSAAALSKTYEDQKKSMNKRPGMLSRMKQSIRTKKGEQMDFDADASTEPDTSWQRLSQVHPSSRT